MADEAGWAGVKQLSGRGTVFVEAADTRRKLAKVQYDLIVTGNVVVGSAAGDADSRASDISGTLQVVQSDADLTAQGTTMILYLEDERSLEFMIEDKMPGGFRIQGVSEIRETS